VLVVKTEPAGAAIRLDGVYMGVSGSRIFVPKGRYTIEAVLPGFEKESSVHDITGRVFASLFFPARYNAEFILKSNDPAAAFALAAADFASWTFAGEPTSNWQIPLSLSEGAYRIGPENSAIFQETNEILKTAARFTVTRAALRDLVRAKMLLDNGGLSPSPAGIISSAGDILAFLSENPGSAAWLSSLLPPESASVLEASSWYKNDSGAPALPGQLQAVRRPEIIEGLSFMGISAEENFLISETPVPRSLFFDFLNENPEWQGGYTDYFQEEIVVFPSEIYNIEKITGITWYAADAFCKWLSNRLPAAMTGMEARLPTEAEWEIAANAITGMEEPGWEWCADPFTHLQIFSVSAAAMQAVGSPERSLRGRPSTQAALTRASLPPELSSPFVSFRIVIAECHE
jgi:hypothetical protein